MKKIILFIAFSISIVAAHAEEFTLSFNNMEVYYDDSLYFSGQANSTIVFNYQNKSGFIHVTFKDDSYILEPVPDSFEEEDGIQMHKMKASSGKILIVAYEPETEVVYLASETEGGLYLFVILKNKTDTANSTHYKEERKEHTNTSTVYNL